MVENVLIRDSTNQQVEMFCQAVKKEIDVEDTLTNIQEFYELTLLDDSKSIQQKTAETIRIANKWEANEGPITTPFKNDRNKISWYANREDNIVRDGAPDAAGPGRVRDIREVRLLFSSSDFPNSMFPLQ
ncbi:hypothetical protein RUM44_010457 [Polyplax serrata]|uniref:Uncharacterized protein n=1 Tax=Polyplax serrata TaxID=468196 RepID=A0ABR1AVK5_POLSC